MFSRSNEAGTSRRPIYKDLVLLQLAALVFLTDQLTKYLVREFLEFRESFPEEGFFRFTHTFNTGSAFGLFQDQNVPLILVSVIGITILALIYRGQQRPGNLLRLSLALQFGGAAGNLLDRVRLGHVTDFVDVGAWPIFNVADASIVVGLALLAWILLGPDSSKRKASTEERPQEHSEAAGIPKREQSQSLMGISNVAAPGCQAGEEGIGLQSGDTTAGDATAGDATADPGTGVVTTEEVPPVEEERVEEEEGKAEGPGGR